MRELVTPQNVNEVIDCENAPFQKYLEIVGANLSGQGFNPCHADNPYHAGLLQHGYEYSHTTPVTQICGKRKVAYHTYKNAINPEWSIGVKCAPGWLATASKGGSGRQSVFFGSQLMKYAKRKNSELKRSV